MDFTKLKELLFKYKQEHLLRFWDELNHNQQEKLYNQIMTIDFELMDSLIRQTQQSSDLDIQVKLTEAELISLNEREISDKEMTQLGNSLIKKGKVAAFLVAGGQGSRLGFEGPKGVYPITPVRKKSLFQLHAEKIRAISNSNNVTIPWYIMTSIANHADTVAFFEENNYFGFDKNDIMFFEQNMLPAVDKNGKMFLEDKDSVFMSPNGHGGSIKAIWDSGALLDMKKRGIEYIFYFQVDNVLTYICDPAFIGYHAKHDAQMSSKVLRKAFPEEKIGIICNINGKTGVVEYSDLPEEDMYAKNDEGELKFWAGSIAIHVINTDFIEKENITGFKLPYHIAEKNIPYLTENGEIIKPADKNGYKFETFVFDALQHCERTISIEVSRELEFSALKNKTGVDSEETTIRDLNRFYSDWLKRAGIEIEGIGNVEISPKFANTEKELIQKKHKIPEKITGNFYLE